MSGKSISVEKKGDVFLVTLFREGKANTFTEEVIKEHLSVLDELESSTENGAIVLTSGDPKFWCNGIDLEWLLTQPAGYITQFKDLLDRMLLRWALCRFPTIGCLTGHAYGGGAILASGLDFRLMRKDRGFFCFPEVDINIPFTEIMNNIIDNLPDKQALHELALTGKRIGGEEALAMKVVSQIHTAEDLLPKALELGQFLAQKNRATYNTIKYGLKSKLTPYLK